MSPNISCVSSRAKLTQLLAETTFGDTAVTFPQVSSAGVRRPGSCDGEVRLPP